MGAPITWQNVNQGDVSTAWRGLDSAGRALNSAFDGLGSVIKQREDLDAGNVAIMGKNNTQAYLDQVATLGKTPEALQAAIADGSLDRLKAGYGANIDHAAVRGAAEALLTTRYAQSKAATEFGHFQADEKAAPLMEAYRTAALANGGKGDQEAMKSIHDQYLQAGGRFQSQLDAFGIQSAEQAAERLRSSGRYDREGVMQNANITHLQNSDRIAQGQLGVAQGNLAINKRQADLADKTFNMTLQDHLDQRESKAIEGLGKARAATASSTEGFTAINDQITKTFGKDESGAQNARQALAEILKAQPGISTAAAMAAVVTQDNSRYLKIDAWVRSNTVDRAKDFSSTPEEILRAKGASLQTDAAQNLYARAHAASLAGPMNQPGGLGGVPVAAGGVSTNPAQARLDAAAAASGIAPGGVVGGRDPLSRAAAAAAAGKGMASGVYPDAKLLAAEARDQAMEQRGPAVRPSAPVFQPDAPGQAKPAMQDASPWKATTAVPGILPEIMGDKNSGISKFMSNNSKLERAQAAAKIAADTELADKVAKAKTASQVAALLEASKNIRRGDLSSE